MNPEDFLTTLASNSDKFISMIEQGAQWEVTAHYAITEAIRAQSGKIAWREAKYKSLVGPQMGEEACDLIWQDGNEQIAMELKVESATNQGQFAGLSVGRVTTLDEGLNWDVQKLSQLSTSSFRVTAGENNEWISEPSVLHRWILVIAWSPTSVGKLRNATGNNVHTRNSTGLMYWLAEI